MRDSSLHVDEASIGGEPAGRPVGHEGTRVEIDESPAWTINGGLALLLVVALIVGGVALIITTGVALDAGTGDLFYRYRFDDGLSGQEGDLGRAEPVAQRVEQ